MSEAAGAQGSSGGSGGSGGSGAGPSRASGSRASGSQSLRKQSRKLSGMVEGKVLATRTLVQTTAQKMRGNLFSAFVLSLKLSVFALVGVVPCFFVNLGQQLRYNRLGNFPSSPMWDVDYVNMEAGVIKNMTSELRLREVWSSTPMFWVCFYGFFPYLTWCYMGKAFPLARAAAAVVASFTFLVVCFGILGSEAAYEYSIFVGTGFFYIAVKSALPASSRLPSQILRHVFIMFAGMAMMVLSRSMTADSVQNTILKFIVIYPLTREFVRYLGARSAWYLMCDREMMPDGVELHRQYAWPFTAYLQLFFAIFYRFQVANISEPFTMAIVVGFQAAMEISLRLSVEARDKFIKKWAPATVDRLQEVFCCRPVARWIMAWNASNAAADAAVVPVAFDSSSKNASAKARDASKRPRRATRIIDAQDFVNMSTKATVAKMALDVSNRSMLDDSTRAPSDAVAADATAADATAAGSNESGVQPDPEQPSVLATAAPRQRACSKGQPLTAAQENQRVARLTYYGLIIVTDMASEYTAIHISPLILVFFSGRVLYMPFSFYESLDEPFSDDWSLTPVFLSALIQLITELCVDAVCISYEMTREGMDLHRAWAARPKSFWKMYMLATWFGFICAWGMVTQAESTDECQGMDFCHCVSRSFRENGLRHRYCLLLYPNSSGIPPF